MGPEWADGGRQLVFAEADELSGTTAFPGHLATVAADGSGRPEALSREDGTAIPTFLSPDGRTVFYTRIFDTELARREVWSLALDDGQTHSVVAGSDNSGGAAISPDGKWLAYWSDQTGRPEVYIRPYPAGGARTPVSIDGGDAPRWSRDGRELYYISNRRMMAVKVETEPVLRLGRPLELFDANTFYRRGGVSHYDVAPDGRFLMIRRSYARNETMSADNVVVITNWARELAERVPAP